MTLAGDIGIDYVPQTADEFHLARDNYRWWSATHQMIQDKNAPEPHRFWWNSIQQRVNWMVETNRNIFRGGRYLILKARQMGISTWVTNRSSWRACKGPHYQALHTAHEIDASELMLSMVKLSYNSLDPTYKLPSGEIVVLKPKEKASSRKELKLVFDPKELLESRIIVKTAGKGEGVGRAFGMNLLHFSELGDTVYDDGQVVGGSLQTLARDAEVFGEGTPNGSSGLLYEVYQGAIAGENDWVPIFLPWFWMDEYRIPLFDGEVVEPENEFELGLMTGTNTFQNYKCSQEQLKWHRFKMRNDCPPGIDMSPLDWFQQEYASNDVDCFLTKGDGYFVVDYVKKVLTYAIEYERAHNIRRYSFVGGQWVEDKFGGPLRLIEEPCKNATYVIGGDAAKGLEHGDYDAAVIIKRVIDGPDVVVGYWRTHEPDKEVHARAMVELGRWHNNALIAIENRPSVDGAAVNQAMSYMSYPNVYIQTFTDEARYKGSIKPEYGFTASEKSKSVYLRDYQSAVREWCLNKNHADGVVIPFRAIGEEMRTFLKVAGKTGAAEGKNDDLVTSCGIALHLRNRVTPQFMNKPVHEVHRPHKLTTEQFLVTNFGRKQANKILEVLNSAN